jgi:hypothetical protein
MDAFVFYLIIPIIFIFLWIIFTMTILPLIGLILSIVSGYLYKLEKIPLVKAVINAIIFLHDKFAIKVLIIAWCICCFIITVLYILYFVAQHILLKEPITVPIAKSILTHPVIEPFIKIGLFPAFDHVFVPMFKIEGNSSGTFTESIKTFFVNFSITAREGPTAKTTTTNKSEKQEMNPNLTEEQNNAVNTKYERCITDRSVPLKDTNSSITLLKYQLDNTNAEIYCKIQKIMDGIRIK